MKKLVFTSLAIAALGSCAGTGSRSALDGKMAELNENLSRSGEFVDAFHGRVSELRSRLATAREDSLKSEIEYSLYKEYQNFNTDSAKAWMTLMMEHPDAGFPIDVLQAWKYAIDGDKDNFKKMFDAFDPGRVDARYRNDCYATLASSYLLLSPTDRRLCQFMTNADNDPATETDVQEMFLGTMRRHENDQLEAREHFMRAYQASSTTHMQSKTAYLLAHTYRETGDNDEYEYWLAQSAIHDLHVPVKSYSAFQDLAMAELERGRFKSASDMVDVFLKDALESKYWVRVNKAVEYEQKIIAKVNRAEKTSICGLMLSTILLLIILVLLLILLKKNVRQRKMLSEANGSIEKINEALKLSDKEKEEYIHKYMKLSLNYLGSVEQYRHKLRVLLKTEGKDAVIAQLRGPSESESQYSDFYKEFDETFLNIYPDFVTRVNELLKPEARFENEHAMNLPLRVLAAIRLGIKESRDIAVFLNCAPSSVYTYRSKMKANALHDKDGFEDKICKIS